MSHNAISHPGPNLDYPLMHSLILLRFSKFVLTFDFAKHFCKLSFQRVILGIFYSFDVEM